MSCYEVEWLNYDSSDECFGVVQLQLMRNIQIQWGYSTDAFSRSQSKFYSLVSLLTPHVSFVRIVNDLIV
jgi:hypothetical protein